MRYKLFSGKPVYNTGNHILVLIYSGEKISWGAFNQAVCIATNQNYRVRLQVSDAGFTLLVLFPMDVTRAQERGYSYRVNYTRQFAERR